MSGCSVTEKHHCDGVRGNCLLEGFIQKPLCHVLRYRDRDSIVSVTPMSMQKCVGIHVTAPGGGCYMSLMLNRPLVFLMICNPEDARKPPRPSRFICAIQQQQHTSFDLQSVAY